MKLVTFLDPKIGPRAGVLSEMGVVDLAATDPTQPSSLKALLAAGPHALAAARAAAESAAAVFNPHARLGAPIPDPGKVICIGLNYRDHAAETKQPIPKEPIVFSKFSSAVVGPDDAVVLPKVSTQIDYEAELVAVVGRRTKNAPLADALASIAGYTVGHDVSARDWQLHKDGKQWLLGKTFDTFAPIGPVLTTADEIPDPQNLEIALRLNGETMQSSTTRQMIFSVAELVAYVSQVVTLEPGDLIFTGTPPGVGVARNPQVFLKPGDVCEVEIAGLGVLRNHCVAEG
ncbi:MAG: fumarylacetoacetate hydrolase family protein [Planctomycetia bacterium]